MFDQWKTGTQNLVYTKDRQRRKTGPATKNTTWEPPICRFEKLQGNTSVTFSAGKYCYDLL